MNCGWCLSQQKDSFRLKQDQALGFLGPDNDCRIVPKTNKTRNLQYRINLGRTQKYDSIWFLRSFTYKQQGEISLNNLQETIKECENTKKNKEIEHNRSKIQFKFNSINELH